MITPNDARRVDISRKKLNEMLDILMNAYSQYRLVNNINSLLEVAFIKICSIGEDIIEEKPSPQIQSSIRQIEKEVEKPKVEEKVEPIVKVSNIIESGTLYEVKDNDIINFMLQGNKMENKELLIVGQN